MPTTTRTAQPMRPKDGTRYLGHYGKRTDPTRTRAARRASKARRQRQRWVKGA